MVNSTEQQFKEEKQRFARKLKAREDSIEDKREELINMRNQLGRKRLC